MDVNVTSTEFRQSESEKEIERGKNGKKEKLYIERYISHSHNTNRHGWWRKLEEAHNNIKSYENDAFGEQDKKREISVCFDKNENGCDVHGCVYYTQTWIDVSIIINFSL